MDALFGLIIFFLICYWSVYSVKLEKKRDQKQKKKAQDEEYERGQAHTASLVEIRKAEKAEERRKAKKAAIRKQKEDSDQAILKAQEERRIREKLGPIQEDFIAEQTKVIEEVDKEVVIQWHKDIISKCQKYESKHPNFLADYEADKASVLFLDSLHFELNLNLKADSMLFKDNKYDWVDVSNEELYLVKLKNTIDDKLYLVVGIANKSAKEDFIDDPVVELEEVVSSTSLNKNVTLFLKECLLNQYKPEGEFDPFARFDGYKGVIELRFIKQALKMIDSFENNKQSAELLLKNSQRMDTYTELEHIFLNYYLYDYGDFNDYYEIHIAHKMPISYRDFLDSLFEHFQSNVSYLNEVGSFYQNELDEINQSYELWLQKKIEIVDNHGHQAFTIYDTITAMRECHYFSKYHPLGLGFDAEKSIDLLHAKGQIEYKTMNSKFLWKYRI